MANNPSHDVQYHPRKLKFDYRRLFFMLLGVVLFLVVYYSPAWPDAVDTEGTHYALPHEGKAAIGLFFWAATWWVFEVVPIGVTAILIGVIQALFLIREPKTAFTDFMDPSVWFIFGSVVIGMSFSRTGLTKRMAYKMLMLVGERTSMIYLGCFVMTAALTLIMAHTAVAAAVFPLLMAIYQLYDPSERPTKFGKGLFIGMAFVAGAGSIITLLGAARGAVAIGFYEEITSTMNLQGPAKIQVVDILEPETFVTDIKTGSNPMALRIQTELSPSTIAMLNNWPDGTEPSDTLLQGLLYDVNLLTKKVICCDSLLLTGEMDFEPGLLRLATMGHDGQDLVRVNRLLVEQSFPGVIKSTYTKVTEITFFTLSKFMFPVGALMTVLLWVYIMFYFKPEQKTIPGLRKRVAVLNESLGPMSRQEILTLIIVASTIILMSSRQFVPGLDQLHKSGIILCSTILFFVFKILTIEDLENIPWNIVLLFGGAMCIGFCLWQTEAAQWIAINWLILFKSASWFVFVLGVAFFVLVMTNFIMNVAAIAIVLPVALFLAPRLGVSPEVIMFSSLVAAGMPFLLLVGAAPNAIAYESKQFTTGEFFIAGVPASILLMVVIGLFVWLIWPMMGMPVTVP